MKMLSLAAFGAAFLLVSCATYDETARTVADIGARVADRELEAAEWVLCKKGTVGAVTRRYGVSGPKANAWNTLCGGSTAKIVRGPE